MMVPASIRHKYNSAARDIAREPEFLQRPSLKIEEQTFQDLLAPIHYIFSSERFYTHRRELDVPAMLEELRYMCLEAQTAHTTKDGCTRERRSELLNVLQNIKECADEGIDANGMRSADMDFFSLPGLTDVIREAAMTHSEFLRNPHICDALMDVADNIEKAHKRLWRPEKKTRILTQGRVNDHNIALAVDICKHRAAENYVTSGSAQSA